MNYKKHAFKDETVALDNNTYDECEFVNCKFEYSGGKPPVMVSCNFSDSSFTFTGQAADTISFMKAMYHGGFKVVVEQTMEDIKKAADQ